MGKGGFVSKWCRRPQGPLIKVYGVSIDVYCHSGFNKTIGGLRDLWSGSLRCLWMHLFKPVPMIQSAAMSDIGGRIYHRLFMAAAISARTYVITWDCSHWPLHVGEGVGIETCSLLTAAALSNRSYVIRIVFSLPLLFSLVCWISPTAVRKKVARVLLGRGLNEGEAEYGFFSHWPVFCCFRERSKSLFFVFVLINFANNIL